MLCRLGWLGTHRDSRASASSARIEGVYLRAQLVHFLRLRFAPTHSLDRAEGRKSINHQRTLLATAASLRCACADTGTRLSRAQPLRAVHCECACAEPVVALLAPGARCLPAAMGEAEVGGTGAPGDKGPGEAAPSPAEETVVWSPEVEVCLFHAMLGHKPVGERCAPAWGWGGLNRLAG